MRSAWCHTLGDGLVCVETAGEVSRQPGRGSPSGAWRDTCGGRALDHVDRPFKRPRPNAVRTSGSRVSACRFQSIFTRSDESI